MLNVHPYRARTITGLRFTWRVSFGSSPCNATIAHCSAQGDKSPPPDQKTMVLLSVRSGGYAQSPVYMVASCSRYIKRLWRLHLPCPYVLVFLCATTSFAIGMSFLQRQVSSPNPADLLRTHFGVEIVAEFFATHIAISTPVRNWMP